MSKKSIIMVTIGVVVLTLGCQSLGDISLIPEPTATPRTWPYSVFDPPYKNVQVNVNEPLEIKSHHISIEQMESIEIRVNGQLLKSEETAGQPDLFPGKLVEVQITRDEAGQIITQPDLTTIGEATDLVTIGQLIEADAAFPSTNKTLSLIWVGRYPGVYNLSLTAKDITDPPGNTIVQQIEVK